MTTTRTATAQPPPELLDVVDEFYPPLELLPPVAYPAALEFASAIRRHDAAVAELDKITDANRPQWPGGNRGNEVHRLTAERHPAAIEQHAAERALALAREVFRMEGVLPHLDEWLDRVDADRAVELAGYEHAGSVIRDAVAKINVALTVNDTHERRLYWLNRMADGTTPFGWWGQGRPPTHVFANGTGTPLASILGALETLAAQLTPAPADNEGAR